MPKIFFNITFHAQSLPQTTHHPQVGQLYLMGSINSQTLTSKSIFFLYYTWSFVIAYVAHSHSTALSYIVILCTTVEISRGIFGLFWWESNDPHLVL